MRAAVIGIGSNSVRSLLADVSGADFQRLWRDREGTRLFAGLDDAGNLDAACIRKTAEAVGRMAAEARQRGAEQVSILNVDPGSYTSVITVMRISSLSSSVSFRGGSLGS